MSIQYCRAIRGNSAQALPPTKWRSSETLESVQRLNEHFLSVLAARASSDAETSQLEIVKTRNELWLGLEPCALKRASRNPVLLAAVHFNNDDWWKWVVRGKRGAWKGIRSDECFSPKVARELMRATLTLAWSGARESESSVALLFGMSKEVAILIGALTPQEIDVIASRHSRELRPRWEDMPSFWNHLLSAARSTDDLRLREVHLYSLQLIASELLGSVA